ncbi:MAG TPA: crossover junction endodeoxyribonuclease RuvC [Alphaproteobacteria bacterium]|nr:crossover junction endodeoxyribonuclease RuvC [Alphaproteobacteria bacterium]
MRTAVRILGLDPGLRVTGWGIIDVLGTHIRHIAHGVICPKVEQDLSFRLKQLFEGLRGIIELYEPDEACVEETFVNKNPASTLKLGMARGVVLMVPSLFDIRVSEYSANKVKKSVVGVGHADKHQISTMVQFLLPGAKGVTADAADALAIALCHTSHRTFLKSAVA